MLLLIVEQTYEGNARNRGEKGAGRCKNPDPGTCARRFELELNN